MAKKTKTGKNDKPQKVSKPAKKPKVLTSKNEPKEETPKKPEMVLVNDDKVDYKYFESYFLAEREKLLQNQKRDEEPAIAADDKADEADMATAELNQEMTLRLRNRELLYLKKVDEALHKIRTGSYGECDSCGDKIGAKRLMARPTATLCIMCKTEQERQESKSIDGNRSKSLGTTTFPKS